MLTVSGEYQLKKQAENNRSMLGVVHVVWEQQDLYKLLCVETGAICCH